MQNKIVKIILIMGILNLTACSTNPLGEYTNTFLGHSKKTSTPQNREKITSTEPVGNTMGKAMDEIDKSKLSHALDNPLGKSTQWTNANTGVSYTVTPTKKITINENPFCREYTIMTSINDKTKEISGTACVGQDGNWQVANT